MRPRTPRQRRPHQSDGFKVISLRLCSQALGLPCTFVSTVIAESSLSASPAITGAAHNGPFEPTFVPPAFEPLKTVNGGAPAPAPRHADRR